ncbi:MAG: Ribosomal RNA small subunit methyltransferase J [Candidatus Dichloromethanomonas elyunquensis]|nr:MAG: Ribosomal RNA small subunit methyltransferase J [Candidatus Dichloromethanomonas elyunquensis]
MILTREKPATAAYKLSDPNLISEIDRLTFQYGLDLIPAETVLTENLPLLKVTRNQIVLEHNDQTFFFHPSMALLRMINILRGEGDRFLQASGIVTGDHFLDATMGLASDALIASWAVGEKGKVIALESSPLIYILVQEGLSRIEKICPSSIRNKDKEEAWICLCQASSRIQTVCCDHALFLKELPHSSMDVIYFDPMFRTTIGKSSSIKPLKNLSYQGALRKETISQALGVARKRLVLKEKRNGGEFERLGFTMLEGSKYNPICFGTIELQKTGGGSSCCL